MSYEELLAELGQLNVKLAVEEGQLRVRAPTGVLTDRLRKALQDNKSQLLDWVIRRQAQRQLTQQAIAARPVDGPIELAYAQRRLWLLQELEPHSSAYNIPLALRLTGPLDVTALQRAWAGIIERHEVLRSCYPVMGGVPHAQVNAGDAVTLAVADVSELTSTQREAALAEHYQALATHVFDLSRGPVVCGELLHLGPDEHALLAVVHHIAADGWSLNLLVGELTLLYAAYSQAAQPRLPPLETSYFDYAHWQQQTLTGDSLLAPLAYWREQLQDVQALDLSRRSRPPMQSFAGEVLRFELTPGVVTGLESLAQRSEASLFMVLLTAFKALLFRYTGQTDICIGTPVANRRRVELEPVVGCFVNSLALRTQIDPQATFESLLGRVRDVCLAAYEHEDLPFELLVEALGVERDMSRTPVFQILFVQQSFEQKNLRTGDLQWEPLAQQDQSAKFDLTLAFGVLDGRLVGEINYCTALFDAVEITGLAGHLQHLLAQVAVQPAMPLIDLPLLDAEEVALQKVAAAGAITPAPAPRSVHGWFEAQAAATPSQVAVRQGVRQLSYAELDAYANQVANWLLQEGHAPGRVGICLERGPDLLAAILGVIKAGSAYVPLDPAYPAGRLQRMASAAGVQVVIGSPQLQQLLPGAARQLLLDETLEDAPLEGMSEVSPARAVVPDDLLYVIFTSGSTGLPKGAGVRHSGMLNLLDWYRREFAFAATDRALVISATGFDLTQKNFFALLTCGGTVVFPAGEDYDPAALIGAVQHDGITLLNCAPSAFYPLVERPGDFTALDSLRCVFLGGEPIQVARLRAWHTATDARCQVVNTYGPTECADIACYHRLTAEDMAGTGGVPLGLPIDNVQVYVLDAWDQLLPTGRTGEICIAGTGVGVGYVDDVELTAERFRPNPFGAGRIYRSGDLGRVRPDGVVEFLGRRDFQVKLHGYRIELGEIEAALRRLPGVDDALAALRQDVLVGYVLSSVGVDEALDWRAELAAHLPAYMLPATLVRVEHWPLSANGKLDRDALPEPRFEATRPYEKPRGAVEEALASIWGEVLGAADIGRQDNFFELGGHSLAASRVAARVREELGASLSLRSLFQAPTIAELARQVIASEGAQPTLPTIAVVDRAGVLPLSHAQRRLWFLQQLEPQSSAYNMPVALRLGGALDVPRLSRSIEAIIRRHEILRTRIDNSTGVPRPIIQPPMAWPLEAEELGASSATTSGQGLQQCIDAFAAQPFDLGREVLRTRLLRLAANEHVLLACLHHVAADGWSVGLLVRELISHYRAYGEGATTSLPDLEIQYVDYAAWQETHLDQDTLARQVEYWQKQLAEVPPLALPTARQDVGAEAARVASAQIVLDASLLAALRSIGQAHGTSVFTVVLAGFKALLARYSGQDDICVGTPVANRPFSELEGLIGPFINTLALRTSLAGNPSFDELLERVKRVVLDGFAHQDVPFEQLVEKLDVARDLDRSPVFQVLFVWQNTPQQPLVLPGLEITPLPVAEPSAKFDLTIALVESDAGLSCEASYNTDLFTPQTIERLLGHFERVLVAVVSRPDQALGEVPLLTP
uniref:amino acid adenylation domain-containing protein n=1 Tax=Immundisolibacter sp. TaxID=1934948 RepID=UPI0035662B7D